MSKSFPKPPVSSFPVWKTMLYGTVMSLLFTFLIWLFNSLAPMAQGDLVDWSLSMSDIFLGSALLPVAFYSRWAWQPRRKNANWHRFTVNLVSCFYISGLLLLAAIMYWDIILVTPWNLLVNGIFVGAFFLVWVLPAISYPLAKRIEKGHHAFDLIILKWGGPGVVITAGILGGSIGLHGRDMRLLIVAILVPLLAVGLAQYFASYLWRYRPWTEEEE